MHVLFYYRYVLACRVEKEAIKIRIGVFWYAFGGPNHFKSKD